MKKKKDSESGFPPDFGRLYAENFGEGVNYCNPALEVNNFVQTDSTEYLTFCDYYWDDKLYLMILEYDLLQTADLLRFKGHRKFKDYLAEKMYFTNKGISRSDYTNTEVVKFFNTPIEVCVEAFLSDEIVYAGSHSYRKFRVTEFTSPKVIDLTKKTGKK
ncbi:MAG: hypothetical protein JSS91_12195 [Bacteroidetes bacterium]|nr:hypothetical protein [Bacteroidota bacterium]